MKILVDEMPKYAPDCPFSQYILTDNSVVCQLSQWEVEMDCTKYCRYLAKGVVANELAGEGDGEKEAGEAAPGDMA